MKPQTQFSIRLFAAVLMLTVVTLVPAALAGSDPLPPGSYAVTVTAADIPPDFPPEYAEILMGTWVTEFQGGGVYVVTKNGEFVATGKYTSNRSHLVVRDIGGPLACTDAHGIANGIYRWELANNQLILTPVLDRCFGRQFVLTLRPMPSL